MSHDISNLNLSQLQELKSSIDITIEFFTGYDNYIAALRLLKKIDLEISDRTKVTH
ncbi:hypothetical protein [Chamaesiphon sp.]|uniref:hypothetical protein n=1 Tax=Chamaesiphon sp. TaxID=2814140 RepID=UPI0035939FB4